MNVAFRTDASIRIGSGHVMRCFALASELKSRGARVRFVCREAPGDSIDWLAAKGLDCDRLPGATAVSPQQEIEQVRERLGKLKKLDWLVVDHYSLGASWEAAMRDRADKILSIDDAASRRHDCDLLLDQNYSSELNSRYLAMVPVGADLLLGPRFALLRPEFSRSREQLRKRSGAVKRVLVFMGGSDAADVTSTVLEALVRLRSGDCTWEVDVVLGAANPHAARIRAKWESLGWVRLHQQTEDMASLMRDADLAVGAGGSSNWERACAGLPSLVFAVAANQEGPLASLVEDGYVAGEAGIPDIERVARWLEVLLSNPAWLRGLARRSAMLADGQGARRVVDRMFSSGIVLRRATDADCEDVWQWRNAPEVRLQSDTPEVIELSTHRRWFERMLEDSAHILLIAEHGRTPVGVVRFDLTGPLAIISVYRVPGASSPGGLIREASRWLRQTLPGTTTIEAHVLATNQRSRAAFLSAGYRQFKDVLRLDCGRTSP